MTQQEIASLANEIFPGVRVDIEETPAYVEVRVVPKDSGFYSAKLPPGVSEKTVRGKLLAIRARIDGDAGTWVEEPKGQA